MQIPDRETQEGMVGRRSFLATAARESFPQGGNERDIIPARWVRRRWPHVRTRESEPRHVMDGVRPK
jgi:hypothetical protein